MASSILVLHVDDEPDFADMAATFLEREVDQIAVETATSASEGSAQRAAGEARVSVANPRWRAAGAVSPSPAGALGRLGASHGDCCVTKHGESIIECEISPCTHCP